VVELTNYYVEKKAEQLAEKLDSREQEVSDSEKDNSVEQRILHPISTNSRRS
jgi:hypothetical protein